MRKNASILEDGIIAGNLYDKYGTKNPLARYLMKGFINSLNELVTATGALEIHEVGCGEGNLSVGLAKQNKTILASDFSNQIIAKARDNAEKHHVDINYKVAGIYDLTPENDAAELIVCCEVLEHLEDSQRALRILTQLANPYLIISVPREPLWSILNLARGKYIKRLGNTPGHIQHWSKRGFLKMVGNYFHICEVKAPLPWTMVLCKIK
ncbi:MAG: methyltransferase domain-containing protein [Planctomycetes bacterium]|nr:methyltransferase domain-containing protein [Planctomycetota bacterium]